MNRLEGLTILNTRPVEQSRTLSDDIIRAGGEVVSCPALKILATASDWLKTLPELHTVKHAIFSSPNAVHFGLKALEHHAVTWPRSIRITAIGHGTARALRLHRITVHNIPMTADSEGLLASDILQEVSGDIILLFKGETGRTLIAETLHQRGAHLIELCVYRTERPDLNAEQFNQLWQNNPVDIILFTSQQSLNNLFTLADQQTVVWLKRTPCLVISRRLADAAALMGIQKIVTADPETIIPALSQFKKGLSDDKKP